MPYLGLIGALTLALYLIIVGISALMGGTAIPAWFVGLLAVLAGAIIGISAIANRSP